MKAYRNNQQGSSLIETVVALFVLAVGLLGVLSMQVKAMQFNQSAYYYSQAVYLANEILESMRANPATAGSYLIGLEDPTPNTADCTGGTVVCTGQQLRNYNLNQWRSNIEATLVSGRSSIQRVDDYYTITIEFDDSRGEAKASEQKTLASYVLVTEIN